MHARAARKAVDQRCCRVLQRTDCKKFAESQLHLAQLQLRSLGLRAQFAIAPCGRIMRQPHSSFPLLGTVEMQAKNLPSALNPPPASPELGLGTSTEPVFQAIFEQSSPAQVLLAGSQGAILAANAAWLRLNNQTRDAVLGRTLQALGIWNFADGNYRASTVRALGKNWVLLTQVPQNRPTASDGSQAGLPSQTEDSSFIQRITSLVPGIVYEFQLWPGGRMGFRFISSAVKDLMGVDAEAVYADSANFSAHVNAEDWKGMWRSIAASLRSMSIWHCEYRAVGADGVERWLMGNAMPQAQADGSSLWCGTLVDITAQKDALVRLQDSESRFRSLTELSSDWYWEQDAEFRFVRIGANRETPVALVTPRFLGTCRWDHVTYGVTGEQWAAHRAALNAHEIFRNFEMLRLHEDGVMRWSSISGAPIFDDEGVFKGYRGTGRDITARKQAEADIERLAFFDVLTGLPNRRLLLDRLNRAIATSSRDHGYGALLFIDLDNFKVLNDTRGHHVGDELLKQVAQRLTDCVRGVDTVARLGGDEFVVMLEELSDTESVAAIQCDLVGQKILRALNAPYQIEGQENHSSPSIGITLFVDHLQSVDVLLQRADLAMYQAKAAGRNTLRFFDPTMQIAASQRATLESDLHLALQRHEFLLHYQPVVDESGRMTGVEALLRWQHPTRGMVFPGEFIAVAEQSSLILSMGQWVLETACAQLVAWAAHPQTCHLTIAVNVSARQFRQPEFASQILDLLGTTGANARRLKLELTESLLLQDVEDAIAKMAELRNLGMGFALDDFGTGYSSLAYLKRLPLDQLKIDRSFVTDVLTDPNDAAIARTILNLAHSMELSVVAEGVETDGQRDFLLGSGCRAFQGYFFGRPQPLAQLHLP